jgi:hypothetical protein
MADARAPATDGPELTELVYELLDAHWDTVQLAGELERQPHWGQHLDYLRDLQRLAREILARERHGARLTR